MNQVPEEDDLGNLKGNHEKGEHTNYQEVPAKDLPLHTKKEEKREQKYNVHPKKRIPPKNPKETSLLRRHRKTDEKDPKRHPLHGFFRGIYFFYLAEENLVTDLVPSEIACLLNSPGRMRRTAVWISREVIVDREL